MEKEHGAGGGGTQALLGDGFDTVIFFLVDQRRLREGGFLGGRQGMVGSHHMHPLPMSASSLTGCLQSARHYQYSVSGEGKLHPGCGSSAALTPICTKAQSDCEELADSSSGITGADSKAKPFPRLDMQKCSLGT